MCIRDRACIGQKAITHIKRDSEMVTVFEGFIDFLSIESWKQLATDVIVLNSCSLVSKAIPLIRQYTKAYLMLDNDKMGSFTTQIINEHCEIDTIDLRRLFPDFKDVNDWRSSQSHNFRS